MSTLRTGPSSRPSRRAPLTAAALAVAASLICGPAALAQAKALPTPSSSGVPSPLASGPSSSDKARNITFGVQPANPVGATPRVYFDMVVGKGTVNRDNVRITNYSNVALRLKVYAANATTALDGGFVVAGFTTHPTDFASWTQITGLAKDGFLSLPARTRIELPVFVTVPSTAVPGDHGGAVVVSYFTTRRDAKGNTVNVENRVASRVYTRVAGPVRAGVKISQLTARDDRAWFPWGTNHLTGSYLVKNTGTVRESIASLMTLAGLVHGRKTYALGGPGDILPGGSVRVIMPSRTIGIGIRSTVSIAVTATQVPVGPGGPALVMSTDRAATAVWTIPWPTLVVVVLVGLLTAGGVLWWKRRAPQRPAPGRRRTNGKPVEIDTLIDLTDREPAQPGVMRRLLAAALLPTAVVVSLPMLLLQTPSADAATGHRLYFAPARGADVTPAYIVADAACPAASSNVVGRAFGHGFPAGGQPVINNSTAGVSHTTPFVLPLQDTMYAFAQLNRTTLEGSYRFTLTCADRLQQRPTTVFTGTMTFSSARHYTAPAPPASVVAAIQADQSSAGAYDSSPAIGSPASPSAGANGSRGPGATPSASTSGPIASGTAAPQAGSDGVAVDLGRTARSSSDGPFSPALAVLSGGALVLAAVLLIVSQRRKRPQSGTRRPGDNTVDTLSERVGAQGKGG